MKKILQILGLTVGLALGLLAVAQEDQMQSETMAASPVHVAQHETLGPYLVDVHGRTLYVVVNGTETVPCEGDCATAWPPFTEEDMMMAEDDTMMADESDTMGEDSSMMATVDPALLGTVTRADGSTQLTYNGHALYYFVGDVNPGEVNCQAVEQFGGIWYVLSPTGEVITTANN
jgi:predicted lipoprotein with Yx(FWY)xxD motif